MSTTLPACPSCNQEYTYEDGQLYICPMCGHEWTKDSQLELEESQLVRDAHGTILNDGDSITVIKDLKVKGSSDSIKKGTNVKSIRLIEPEDGHDIECKIPGFGQMKLKSEFVKKI
ncbi:MULTISPECIES: zinc ribbon domain-containing protein YjdM [Nosocomiicoccus]|uniref:zinc ribbon domain-containing protein YjdM n=1 Tax=Nosocomiicoccus TaxID=489909 RepID=UPI00082E473E|nr:MULTISPECIES: zinc ribbon domain-containing protein YjdM [Nosocomiicoccus]OFO55812.1 alkylphosphonate utilization protein [Nosocomiicoccus sp. HMSC059G07]